MQNMPERGDAAVVKIRRAGPDAVERLRNVALRFAQVRQLAVIGEPTAAVGISLRGGEGLKTDWICFDFVKRHDPRGPGVFFGAGLSVRPMTVRADAIEGKPATSRERVVDRIRIFR